MDRFNLTPSDLAALPGRVLDAMAGSFASVFIVATVLVACYLVPAYFLPRRKHSTPDGELVGAALLVGH